MIEQHPSSCEAFTLSIGARKPLARASSALCDAHSEMQATNTHIKHKGSNTAKGCVNMERDEIILTIILMF